MSDKNYFEEAKQNMQNKVSGFDANSVSVFNETNTPNSSSNDDSHLEQNAEMAKQRMSRSGMGQAANNIEFFAHTGEKNKSSNDPDFIQSAFQLAMHKKYGENNEQ